MFPFRRHAWSCTLLLAFLLGAVSTVHAQASAAPAAAAAPARAPATTPEALSAEETAAPIPWKPLLGVGAAGVAVQAVYGVVMAPIAVLCFPAWAVGAVLVGALSAGAQWRVASWLGWRVPMVMLGVVAVGLGAAGAVASSGFMGCGAFMLLAAFILGQSERLQGVSLAASGAVLLAVGLAVSMVASVLAGVLPALTAVWLGRAMVPRELRDAPHVDLLEVPPPPRVIRLRPRNAPAPAPAREPDGASPRVRKRNRAPRNPGA